MSYRTVGNLFFRSHLFGNYMTEGLSTRDRIIDAAFSFYRNPVFTNISLSQIAQKVGISKAAIFKHFSNKEALGQALFERMFDGIAEAIRRMIECYKNGKRVEAMSEAIDFLVNHREYVMYFQSRQCIADEATLVHELRKRGVAVPDSFFRADGSLKDIDLYVTSIYVGTTIFIFALLRFQALDTNAPNIADSADFADKLAALIENGIGKNIPEKERLAQLDARFKSVMQKKAPLTDELLAFASVVSEYGAAGITIERVAKKLRLAKSSLYSRYKNKSEMIESLIKNEVIRMHGMIAENIEGLTTGEECTYAVLRTELLYFIKYPEIVDICSSLIGINDFVDRAEAPDFVDTIYDSVYWKRFIASFPDVGIPPTSRRILGWFFALVVTMFIHCRRLGFSDKRIFAALKKIYAMAESGIGALPFDVSDAVNNLYELRS